VTYIVNERELGRSERLSMWDKLFKNTLFSLESSYSGNPCTCCNCPFDSNSIKSSCSYI